MKIKGLVILLFAFIFLNSCKKKEDLEYDNTPNITFQSISPGTVKAYQDSISISIQYTDGDGDLGENVSGVENAFIKDLRNNLTYGLRIRQLSPDNSEIIIKGIINLVIPAVGLNDSNGQPESASFEVYIEDRAGNKSNRVTTTAITVNP